MATGLPWIRAYTNLRTDPRSLALASLLQRKAAWLHVLGLRTWLGERAPRGVVDSARADLVVEEAAGWDGPSGALVAGLVSVGFLREVAGGNGKAYEDVDWPTEQAAHVAKVERDRKKPRAGQRHAAQVPPEVSAEPARESARERVESRELREEKEASLAGPAVAAPPDVGTRFVTPTQSPVSGNSAEEPPEADQADVTGEIPPRCEASAIFPEIPHHPTCPLSTSPAKPESSPPALRLEVQQAEPPPKRAPVAKAARKSTEAQEKPPDPRHRPLVDAMCAAFLEATGAAYSFTGRSAKTVSALLLQADCGADTRGDAAAAAILQRWRWGLGWKIALSGRLPVQTFEQLLQHWNELTRKPPDPEEARRNPNAPTAGATVWDWTGAATGKETTDA